MQNTNIKEKFKKLFFEKRWLPTKDKEISEVAFDGIWNFIESTISQTRKEGYQSGVNDQAGQYKEYVEEEKKKARQEAIEEIKKKIRARRRVLKELYKKYTLEIDEHRLDELYQLDKLLEDLNNK